MIGEFTVVSPRFRECEQSTPRPKILVQGFVSQFVSNRFRLSGTISLLASVRSLAFLLPLHSCEHSPILLSPVFE